MLEPAEQTLRPRQRLLRHFEDLPVSRGPPIFLDHSFQLVQPVLQFFALGPRRRGLDVSDPNLRGARQVHIAGYRRVQPHLMFGRPHECSEGLGCLLSLLWQTAASLESIAVSPRRRPAAARSLTEN